MKCKNFINETNYFSRQDVLKIVNITDRKLGYLEKTELIKPILRMGRKIYYSWTQLLEIKTIVKLREYVSLQTIRETIKNLEIYCNVSNLSNKKLVAYNNKVILLDIEKDLGDIISIEMSGKNTGQIVIHQILVMNNIVNELLENGKNNIVDFNKRLKAENIDYSGVREAIAS
jgi:DNA-binding transcriptional MerR regulator